jgi:hypothetical protein
MSENTLRTLPHSQVSISDRDSLNIFLNTLEAKGILTFPIVLNYTLDEVESIPPTQYNGGHDTFILTLSVKKTIYKKQLRPEISNNQSSNKLIDN